jgi:hypothetical protein
MTLATKRCPVENIDKESELDFKSFPVFRIIASDKQLFVDLEHQVSLPY